MRDLGFRAEVYKVEGDGTIVSDILHTGNLAPPYIASATVSTVLPGSLSAAKFPSSPEFWSS